MALGAIQWPGCSLCSRWGVVSRAVPSPDPGGAGSTLRLHLTLVARPVGQDDRRWFHGMTYAPTYPIRPPVPYADPDTGPSDLKRPIESAVPGGHVRARSVGPVVVLDVAGRLSEVVEELDLAARFSLAEGPKGVVCDLSSVVEVNAPGALRALATSGRHPRDWPGVPLAVAGLTQRAGDTLGGKPLGGHLMVIASLREALSSVLQASLPAVESLRLAPDPTAARASRDFVSRALLDWRLSRLISSARLVVTELVTNATTHAGTDIELTVSKYRGAVRLAVADRSPNLPVERHDSTDTHGRGLIIIKGLSSACGVLPNTDGGKVVWAVLTGSLMSFPAQSPAQHAAGPACAQRSTVTV
jgi:anti-sigma regulatory factor (Ser/Thr protein kinase)